jgi:hypothetical protein
MTFGRGNRMSGFFRVPGPLGLAEAPLTCRGVGAGTDQRAAARTLATRTRSAASPTSAAPEMAIDRDPYGAYGVALVLELSLNAIAEISRHTGIHPDVLGPCRRTAAKLGLVIMFRAIKPAAMEYVGQKNMLPKPPALKVKCHDQLGVIAYSGPDKEAKFKSDVMTGLITPGFKEAQGLHLDLDGTAAAQLGIRPPPDVALLVDRQGRAFFSDMDLFQVLDAEQGAPVDLGSGGTDDRAGPERAQLDAHLNILTAVGIEFALIQHGAERQWVKHTPKDERIAAFGPDGAIWTFETYAAATEFEQRIIDMGYRRGHMLRHFRFAYRGG